MGYVAEQRHPPELVADPPRFDLVLMVDFLHHLNDNQVLTVLAAVRELAL